MKKMSKKNLVQLVVMTVSFIAIVILCRLQEQSVILRTIYYALSILWGITLCVYTVKAFIFFCEKYKKDTMFAKQVNKIIGTSILFCTMIIVPIIMCFILFKFCHYLLSILGTNLLVSIVSGCGIVYCIVLWCYYTTFAIQKLIKYKFNFSKMADRLEEIIEK